MRNLKITNEKAKEVLEAAGFGEAFTIFEKPNADSEAEGTIKDIVGKLIKYGSVSEKQMAYVGKLVERIKNAPAIAAARAAEAAAAAPVPVVEGRTKVEGEVLSVKIVDGFYGTQIKMLIRHESGFKLWGNCPSAIADEVGKGDKVSFFAAIKPSDNDPKFGFWSRPTKPALTKAA